MKKIDLPEHIETIMDVLEETESFIKDYYPNLNKDFKTETKEVKDDISELDEIIKEYWLRRNLGIFNEDCFYYSDLNPFLPHKQFLKELLT
mgnify:CR=1 FL=1